MGKVGKPACPGFCREWNRQGRAGPEQIVSHHRKIMPEIPSKRSILKSYENAADCPALGGEDECSDFKNPIGRTFLPGSCIF
jgi:hypothetical protein